MSALRVVTGVAILVALARPAAAHPLDLGYLRITSDGRAVSVALELHVNAAAHLIAAAPEALEGAALQRRAAELADASVRGAPIATPAGPCAWTTAIAALHDRTAQITAEAVCPAPVDALRWRFPFIAAARVSPTFQILVKAAIAGQDRVAIVDPAHPELALSALRAVGFTTFVWTGVEHIGAAPSQWRDRDGWKLPDGVDHILFLCALMLAGGTLLEILAIVSGFTLGHSITLALSALHLVRPPTRLIEPLIALTIALVAAQVVRGRSERHRCKLAACFGLIHGFGFAGALNEMDLSTGELVRALFGYNLGVELGQVAIVLAVAPAILYLHRHRRGRPIVRGLALVICLAGLSWFVQRIG